MNAWEPADDIEAAAQRNDMARVIVFALLSQGYIAGTDAPSIGLAFLRELEDCGYTLRLTTHEERLEKNMRPEASS